VGNRRKFIRFPVRLNARYSEENSDEWNQCSVIDISREGMGVIVYLKEKISLGSILKLVIDVQGKKAAIFATGTMIWIKELKDNLEFNFIGGIKLITIDPKSKWILLDHAYEAWRKIREAKTSK
jgi:hypothetical protein